MRDLLLAVGALLGLAAVGYGGWWLLTESDLLAPGGPERPGPAETVDRFLAAWESGDVADMRAYVREPSDDFDAAYEQFFTAMEPDELRLEPGEVDEVQDGRVRAPVDVTVVREDYGELEWSVELELLRERGEWGLAWEHEDLHPQLRPGVGFEVEHEELDRAPITAVDGTPLARSGDAVTIGFAPGPVDDPDELADAFAQAVPGSESTVERTYARGGLRDDWFYPVVTLSEERADEVRDQLLGVDGVIFRSDQGRTVLEENLALHVVGRVDEVTAEQLEQADGAYEEGDEIGQFGLEERFEEELLGATRVRVLLREAEDDRIEEVLVERTSVGAEGLRTTLDVDVQRAAERALAGIEDEAAIVVVDVADGAIRASASRPLGGYNRAFEGRYPPGSTFKIVTAEALLAAGADPGDEAECPSSAIVGGLSVRNAGERELGTTTLSDAFAWSCNTTFARAAAELGAEELTGAAARFGFGEEPALPLPAFGGSFPEPTDTAEVAAASFGQARVEVSPLHLASVAAAARGGTWHAPYLLADEEPGASSELADGTLEDLRSLLRAVVTDGNGSAADVSDDPPVEGKTGTAQAGDDVEHAWFAGSWDDLGFAILVEDGGSGADVAAPIAGRLVEELQALTEE